MLGQRQDAFSQGSIGSTLFCKYDRTALRKGNDDDEDNQENGQDLDTDARYDRAAEKAKNMRA